MNSFTAPSTRPWTTLECQDFDRDLQSLGLPPAILMEQAARSLCDFLISHHKGGLTTTFLYLCGPGNNGADGIAAARQMLGHPHLRPIVTFPYGEGSKDSLLQLQLQAFQGLGGKVLSHPPEAHQEGVSGPLLIVDALFGVGLTRPHSLDPIAPWRGWVDKAEGILAVDCPSGLDCTTGKVLGEALKATWTLSFVAPKAGFVREDGPSHCGEVLVAGIGVRPEIADAWLARGQRFPGQS